MHTDELHDADIAGEAGPDQLELPFLHRLKRRHYSPRELILIDLIVVLLLTLLNMMVPAQPVRVTGGIWSMMAVVTATCSGILVLWRRRYPRATIWVVLPFALLSLGMRAHQAAAFFVLMALYSAATVLSRGRALALTLFTSAAVVVAITIGGGEQLVSASIGAVAILLVGWLAAENTKASRIYRLQRAERMRERRAALEAEQAERVERAVADERVKIARELHDIVAHGMSVIAVRSAVAKMVLDAQPEEAREALGIIETTSRRSLREMRMLVGVLRDDDSVAAADLAPAPTWHDVKRLIEDVRSAGVQVDVEVVGERYELPAAAELTVFRILQEALTNVVRHAGPTCARVAVTFGSGAIDLDVLDDGPPADGASLAPTTRAGGGHGLIGMRERVALFGGEVSAGPAGAGFRVRAHLPLTEPSASVAPGAAPPSRPSAAIGPAAGAGR